MFCTSRELRTKPLARRAFGRDWVAFRTRAGRVGVLLGQCAHMGARLVQGEIVSEHLRCPFHHWEFDTTGRCVHIPATADIPDFARLLALPAVEQHRSVFIFNGAKPAFPLPFFDRCDARDLATAPPFTIALECPWYMVGANGVDVQHFQATHGREPLGPPQIDHPQCFAHQAVARFRVAGRGWRDGLTRRIAGSKVEMDVTDWAGTLFFVRATFRRTRTYGMVSLLPVEKDRTLVFVRISVRRSRHRWGRLLWDPINSRVRRYFVRKFLEPDIARSAGTRFDPRRLITADQLLAQYFSWLYTLHGPSVIPAVEHQHAPKEE
jgi:phenylpropionate dioxygenase-like ring-hydroxylating dioxygenase large terminal subunit